MQKEIFTLNNACVTVFREWGFHKLAYYEQIICTKQ
jgi:hypothetical protein